MCTYCWHKNVTMKKIEAKVLYTHVASGMSRTILLITFLTCRVAMQTLRESFTLFVVVVLWQISNFFLPSCPVLSNISNLFKNAYHGIFGIFSLVFQKWLKWLKQQLQTIELFFSIKIYRTRAINRRSYNSRILILGSRLPHKKRIKNAF